MKLNSPETKWEVLMNCENAESIDYVYLGGVIIRSPMKSRTRNFKQAIYQADKSKNYCCIIQNLVMFNITKKTLFILFNIYKKKKTAKEKFFPTSLFKNKTANEIKVILQNLFLCTK